MLHRTCFGVFALVSSLIGQDEQEELKESAEMWFPTKAPELHETENSLIPLLSAEDYRSLMERMKNNAAFVGIQKMPADLSERARFGFNLTYSGRNRSFVLDETEDGGYLLYADVNGNGDLVDDARLRLERHGDEFRVWLRTEIQEVADGLRRVYPVHIKLVLGEAVPPGQTEPIRVLKKYDAWVRRGRLWLGDQESAFALVGRRGLYDTDEDEILVDLDGDGLDFTDPSSPDLFRVSDKKMRVHGVTYEFYIDPYGGGVKLVPLTEVLPERPSLQPGSRVPDVVFLETNGRSSRLSEFRGKVLLLDFWATWCAPCRGDAPRLVGVYNKYRDQGFEVLGVNPGDPEAEIQAFKEQFGVEWRQMVEPFDGRVHDLFRVRRWPTYYLIGRDGRILLNHIEWSNLEAALEEALR